MSSDTSARSCSWLAGFVALSRVAMVSLVVSPAPPGSAKDTAIPATNGARTMRAHSSSVKSLFVVTAVPSNVRSSGVSDVPTSSVRQASRRLRRRERLPEPVEREVVVAGGPSLETHDPGIADVPEGRSDGGVVDLSRARLAPTGHVGHLDFTDPGDAVAQEL